ncbi:hypothetical protein ACWCQK_35120 [Streptomyces sp. NPDC002306]
MPGTFAFTAHRGSFGCQARNSQESDACYGVVQYDRQVCRRVPEHPDNRPGRGWRIPGFASLLSAARFLYRYRKPAPAGRR